MMNSPLPCHALPTPSPPPEPATFHKRNVIQAPLTPEPEEYEIVCVKKPIAVQPRPFVSRWLNVIQRLLKELDGRDKLMKIIQYFIKILLHYNLVKAKHWSTITSHFSMTRKLLRLGSGLGPIRQFSPLKSSLSETLILSNAIVNHISDDVFCLYKLGALGAYLGDRSERLSAYCWFAGILVDIRDNVNTMLALQHSKKSDLPVQERQQKIFVTEISIIKLLMDGIFCACDIWQPSHSASTQAWSGFMSGLLAGYKLWIKFSV
ncbi:hypothetical protein INT47_007726 [Mucor saturninus]|uniref:Peroxisomal biogenesis factor 11 n=1 Tax=Mucor saturninus TaxID=64648 RepID=A0A8H7QWM1_9FUNG|nr:hypothetical protein INT47_007726 [Mucor saturninus]